MSKKSDRSRSKVKETAIAVSDASNASRSGRGRGALEGRGRGRGAERGRGGRGGRAGSHAPDTRTGDKSTKSIPDGWADSVAAAAPAATGIQQNTRVNGENTSWDQFPADEPPYDNIATQDGSKGNAVPEGKVKGWAGLFATSAPPGQPKKSEPTTMPKTEESGPGTDSKTTGNPSQPPPTEGPIVDAPADISKVAPSDPSTNLAPSKDDLTQDNLEQLPDLSHPPATVTAASTVASTPGLHNDVSDQQAMPRSGMSGYAASAMKATSGAGRSSSFQRRVMAQQEPVVMPEHHAVSRAAMQFGSMDISSGPDDAGADEDREDPETRTPLPADSPVAPRASLPPPPVAQPQLAADATSTARPAPGLPPAPRQQSSSSPPHTTAYADQFVPYGQSSQKAYDTFGQQSAQQLTPGQDTFPPNTSAHAQLATTAAPSDYSTAFHDREAQRNIAYQNYYGYGQNREEQPRTGSGMGTSGAEQQGYAAPSRMQTGYGPQDVSQGDSSAVNPALSAHQQQHQPHQGQGQHMHQGQNAHGGYSYGYAGTGYNQPYGQYPSYMNQISQHQYGQNRPMFDDVRRYDESYMSHGSQYGSYGRQYGGSHYNKSGLYNQPQHQFAYDHSSSSPANAGAYSQPSSTREGMYGRAGSVHPSESQQTTTGSGSGSAFGGSGMTDPFSRDQTGFAGHTPMSQQQQQQQQQHQSHNGQLGALDDSSKGYEGTGAGVAAKVGGPSPSINNAHHRPNSAANHHMQSQHGASPHSSGLAVPHSQQGSQQQAAFGGYSPYGAFGGAMAGVGTGHHQHSHLNQQGPQSSHPHGNSQPHYAAGLGGYGSGGSAAFGSYAGGYAMGRGWGSSAAGGNAGSGTASGAAGSGGVAANFGASGH